MYETKLLRLSEVLEIIGLVKTNLYGKLKRGEFPVPLKLGKRAVAWKQSDIEEWINTLPQVDGCNEKRDS